MVTVSMIRDFICVLVMACFCTIMTMENWASKFSLQSLRQCLVYYLYTVFFLVGIVSVVYSVLRNSRSTEVLHRHQDQQTFLLSFTGMGIFFTGILITDSIKLADTAYCIGSYIEMNCDMSKIVGYVVYHFGKPAYLAVQLTFMVWTRYHRLSRGYNLSTKIGHSVNIAINLALIIFYCSNYETIGIEGQNNTYSPGSSFHDFFLCNNTRYGDPAPIYNITQAICMAGNTTLLNLDRAINPYTFPMQVQLAFLAISVMIGQVAMVAKAPSQGIDEVSSSHCTSLYSTNSGIQFFSIGRRFNRLLNALPPFLRPSGDEETQPLLGPTQPSVFNPVLVLCLFLSCLQIISSIVGGQDLPNTLWFVVTVAIIWHISLIITNSYILRYMWTNEVRVCAPLPSSAIVILVSSACAYSILFYNLIANADILARPSHEWEHIKNTTNLTDGGLKLYVISGAFNFCIRIICVVLQSLIIIRVCRELSTSGYCLTLTGKVRTALYYLMFTNIVGWFWDSTAGVKVFDSVKVIYYSKSVWKSLKTAFMPGFMYFEFHSGMILAEYMIAQWYHSTKQQPSNVNLQTTLPTEPRALTEEANNNDNTPEERPQHYNTM